MASLTRTRAACLTSAEAEARNVLLTAQERSIIANRLADTERDYRAKADLIERVRSAKLDETAGSVGVTAALVGLVWLFGKCAPTLLPWLFY